jgi:hypothetical protein
MRAVSTLSSISSAGTISTPCLTQNSLPLVDPSLTFIIVDRDFLRLSQPDQRARIRVVEANDVRDPARALPF